MAWDRCLVLLMQILIYWIMGTLIFISRAPILLSSGRIHCEIMSLANSWIEKLEKPHAKLFSYFGAEFVILAQLAMY